MIFISGFLQLLILNLMLDIVIDTASSDLLLDYPCLPMYAVHLCYWPQSAFLTLYLVACTLITLTCSWPWFCLQFDVFLLSPYRIQLVTWFCSQMNLYSRCPTQYIFACLIPPLPSSSLQFQLPGTGALPFHCALADPISTAKVAWIGTVQETILFILGSGMGQNVSDGFKQ